MNDAPFTEREFRIAMSNFATGVCVLGAKRRDGAAIGMTVNSFTSVSLNPPLVLVCLGAESARTQAIVDSGRFSISILASDQREIADHFAQPGEGLAHEIDWVPGRNGAPLAPGAAAIVECDIDATHTAGDHLIVIGRVTHVDSNPDCALMVYARSTYRELD